MSISASPSVGDEAAELRLSIATGTWAASLAGEGSFLFLPFAVFVERVSSGPHPAPIAPVGDFWTVDLGTEAEDSTLCLLICPATSSFCSPRAGHDCIPQRTDRHGVEQEDERRGKEEETEICKQVLNPNAVDHSIASETVFEALLLAWLRNGFGRCAKLQPRGA